MRALLRAASVMTASEVGIWRAIEVPPQFATWSRIYGSIGVVMIGMVRLTNNYCGNFPLVVSMSLTFIFFLSLV